MPTTSSLIDIDRVRLETPGCRNCVHFNNAGSSLMPEPVFKVVSAHLELEMKYGGYEALNENWDAFNRFYTSFADLLNCEPGEIAYAENATRAWDMAFYSIAFEEGDRILTAKSEYVSNYLAFLQMTRRRGVSVEVVPNDDNGQVSLQRLEEMIDARVKLIAITHVPTHSGLVNPVNEVGEIANRHGILYLLDACQSAGQSPLDVRQIGCSMMSTTGRKFLRGPRGTGALYVNNSAIEQLSPPFIDLQSATWTELNEYEFRPGARRFETWERYVAGQIGLARAVAYALEVGLDAIGDRTRLLGATLRRRLGELDGVTTHDTGEQLCGIVTFTKSNEKADTLKERLYGNDINVDINRAVNARLDMVEPEWVRASVHYFNTDREIDRFCKVLMQ